VSKVSITISTAEYAHNKHDVPVFTAANKARKLIAYMIDFFLSNLPGLNIQAVAG